MSAGRFSIPEFAAISAPTMPLNSASSVNGLNSLCSPRQMLRNTGSRISCRYSSVNSPARLSSVCAAKRAADCFPIETRARTLPIFPAASFAPGILPSTLDKPLPPSCVTPPSTLSRKTSAAPFRAPYRVACADVYPARSASCRALPPAEAKNNAFPATGFAMPTAIDGSIFAVLVITRCAKLLNPS